MITNKLTENYANQLINDLKNNDIKFHQFYNTDITAEENNLIKFNNNFEEDTSLKRLNKTYYDIEVINNLNEFPDPEKHKFPVNSIATYNNILNTTDIFVYLDNCNIMDHDTIQKGIEELFAELIIKEPKYQIDNLKIKLHSFKTEVEMLESFFEHMKSYRTLILMGFNSSGFDDPYVINRINKLLGKSAADEVISDFGEVKQYGKRYSIIDYDFVDLLHLYKPIDSQGAGYGKSLPDFKLNTISKKELGLIKLDMKGGFYFNFHNDIIGFLTYNMLDTLLLAKVDEKLQFTELIFDLGKHNKSTFSSSLTGRSIMFKNRNNDIFTKQGKIIRTRKFGDEVSYPLIQ